MQAPIETREIVAITRPDGKDEGEKKKEEGDKKKEGEEEKKEGEEEEVVLP